MSFVDPHDYRHGPVDVFVSGSHRDLKIRPLTELLKSAGLSIFHSGLGLPAGMEYTTYIQHYLEHANTILVCWCPDSIKSAWVNGEAEFARIKERLVACKTETCDLMPPFNIFQTVDLTGWNVKDGEDANFRALVKLLKHRASGGIATFSQ